MRPWVRRVSSTTRQDFNLKNFRICFIYSIIDRMYIVVVFLWLAARTLRRLGSRQRHKKRQATQHGCLTSLLGDGDKGIEIMYGEEKIFCTGQTRAAKACRTKISCTGTTSPKIQPRKDAFYMYSLSHHLGHLSLVSLVGEDAEANVCAAHLTLSQFKLPPLPPSHRKLQGYIFCFV